MECVDPTPKATAHLMLSQKPDKTLTSPGDTPEFIEVNQAVANLVSKGRSDMDVGATSFGTRQVVEKASSKLLKVD